MRSDKAPAPQPGTGEFSAVVRRLAAYGAVTRITGYDHVVTLDGTALTLDDGDDHVRLAGPGDVPEVPANWASDAAAKRTATDWIEEYLDDTYQFLVIRRDAITDLIDDPFSPENLDRLADRFPNVDLAEVQTFLADVRSWLAAGPTGSPA